MRDETISFTKVSLGTYGPTAHKIFDLMRKRWKKLGAGNRYNYGSGSSYALNYSYMLSMCTEFAEENDGDVTFSFGSRYLNRMYYSPHKHYAESVPNLMRCDNDPVAARQWLGNEVAKFLVNQDPNNPDEYILLHGNNKTSLYCAKYRELLLLAKYLRGEDISDENMFPPAVVKRVIGSASDPIKTELAAFIQEEIKKIEKKYSKLRDATANKAGDKIFAAKQKMWNEENAAQCRFKETERQIAAERTAAYAELDKQKRAEISALKKSMKAPAAA